MASTVTLQNLTDRIYDILRESESDTSAYPLDFLQDLVNSAQKRICSWTLMNPFTQTAVRKWRLPFLNTDKFYSNLAWTSSTAVAVVWATTLNASTTDYPTSWSLYVDWNLLTYTGTSATQFTGIPASWDWSIKFAHISWTKVYAAFNLPSDFLSATQVIYNSRYKLEAQLYDDIFENLNKVKGTNYNRWSQTIYNDFIRLNPFYTIIDETYLVPFNLNNTGDKIHLRYLKKPTAMSATTDTATISDDEFALSTLPYIACGELLFNRWEEQRATQILNFGLNQTKELYSYYNNKSFENPSKTAYRTGKSNFLNI